MINGNKNETYVVNKLISFEGAVSIYSVSLVKSLGLQDWSCTDEILFRLVLALL